MEFYRRKRPGTWLEELEELEEEHALSLLPGGANAYPAYILPIILKRFKVFYSLYTGQTRPFNSKSAASTPKIFTSL